ncbi:sulfite exporter TauE/SafE family protein [Leucothrix sargassi]|nr:sulfite exporter TauE/SafE family protein [Leucothrix sargassi]
MLLDPFFYLMAIPAVLIVGISKGGFGGGLGVVAVPILTLAIDPVLAAAIMLPILCTMDLMAVKAFWKKWDSALLISLLPSAVVGILIGTFSFHLLNADAIKLLIGVLAIGFTLQHWLKKQPPETKPSKARGAFWSTISGFTSFVAHAGGPPITFYLLPLKLEKSVYQGTSVAFFTAINYIKLIPYFFLGQLSLGNMKTSLTLLPVAFIGVYLGIYLHKRMSQDLFFKLAYLFLFLTGLKLTWDGVVAFF